MEISKEFGFEAAHRLPFTPPGHKCHRLHGHSFKVEIVLRGALVEPQGWVRDFAEITDAFAPLHKLLDHQYLNEVEGLANPTSEVLAKWVWDRIKVALPDVARVTVRETCTSSATYTG